MSHDVTDHVQAFLADLGQEGIDDCAETAAVQYNNAIKKGANHLQALALVYAVGLGAGAGFMADKLPAEIAAQRFKTLAIAHVQQMKDAKP